MLCNSHNPIQFSSDDLSIWFCRKLNEEKSKRETDRKEYASHNFSSLGHLSKYFGTEDGILRKLVHFVEHFQSF